jgi:hypothetical protein
MSSRHRHHRGHRTALVHSADNKTLLSFTDNQTANMTLYAVGTDPNRTVLCVCILQCMSTTQRLINFNKNPIKNKGVVRVLQQKSSYIRDVSIKSSSHFHSPKQPAIFAPIVTPIRFTINAFRSNLI